MQNMRYKDFWKFIDLLAANGLLEYVVVIGSWAEYLYSQCGVLKGFEANLRTLDIDFLVRNLHRPTEPVSITALAKENGYTVAEDYLYGTTKLFTPELMEIEFLILQKGAGEETALKTNLGVKAQALRHLEIISENILPVEFNGCKILVPEPEAYVIHKMIINSMRGKKADKDKAAIQNLMPYINMERFAELSSSLSKKEASAVRNFVYQQE